MNPAMTLQPQVGIPPAVMALVMGGLDLFQPRKGELNSNGLTVNGSGGNEFDAQTFSGEDDDLRIATNGNGELAAAIGIIGIGQPAVFQIDGRVSEKTANDNTEGFGLLGALGNQQYSGRNATFPPTLDDELADILGVIQRNTAESDSGVIIMITGACDRNCANCPVQAKYAATG